NPPGEAMDVIKKAPVHRTPVDWALQFLWNMPEISCVLSGMGSMKMVEENCASADNSGIGSMHAGELEVIDQLAGIYKKNILVPCTACQYCMPCPSGVNIPMNFGYLNTRSANRVGSIVNKATPWLVASRYRNLATNKNQLSRKPNSGNASLCVRCNACVPKCPQGIKIPDMLEKVDMVFGKHKKIRDVFPPA
nr:4Fe-4S dicluster domain-containing protein [Candidatus Sigynarchaeota archaeon]